MVISEKRYSAEAAPPKTPIASRRTSRGCRAVMPGDHFACVAVSFFSSFREGSRGAGRAPAPSWLFAAEPEAHADIGGSAERRIAEHVLIILVKEIGDVANHAGVRG